MHMRGMADSRRSGRSGRGSAVGPSRRGGDDASRGDLSPTGGLSDRGSAVFRRHGDRGRRGRGSAREALQKILAFARPLGRLASLLHGELRVRPALSGRHGDGGRLPRGDRKRPAPGVFRSSRHRTSKDAFRVFAIWGAIRAAPPALVWAAGFMSGYWKSDCLSAASRRPPSKTPMPFSPRCRRQVCRFAGLRLDHRRADGGRTPLRGTHAGTAEARYAVFMGYLA